MATKNSRKPVKPVKPVKAVKAAKATHGGLEEAPKLPTYLFELGNPETRGVAGVIRVRANDEQEALMIARNAADELFNGCFVMKGSDSPGLDSFRVYADGRAIHLRHLVDVSYCDSV